MTSTNSNNCDRSSIFRKSAAGAKSRAYVEFAECLKGRGDVTLAGVYAQNVPAEFNLSIIIDDVNKFLEYKEDGAVFGTARMPTLSPYSLVIMEGRVSLVAANKDETANYQMQYELPMEARSGALFTLVGTKKMPHESGHCGGCGQNTFDTTKMTCVVHEGVGSKGKVLGQGLLQIDFMDAMKMLFSFKGRGSGRFKQNFVSNLASIYFRGLMPKSVPAITEDVLASPHTELDELEPKRRGSVTGDLLLGKRRSTVLESLNQISRALIEEGDCVDSTRGIDGDFAVTNEELAMLRAGVQSEFPEDYKYLSDAYIMSVASKPYSKDPKKRRPLEYTQKKLRELMQWRSASSNTRADDGCAGLEDLIKMANASPTAPQAVQNPDKLKQARAIAKCLNNNSTYFHGLTKDGRPVLWIRTDRRPWYPDIQADMSAFVAVTDAGVRGMPDGITDFVAVVETSSPPPPNPGYMIAVLETLVKGYPDRANRIVVAPVGGIVQFVMKILQPIMPGTIASKLVMAGAADAKATIAEMLLNGEDDLPTFMGGTANHDEYYPQESKCPNRGQGILKFDYFGMVERLGVQRKEYEGSAQSRTASLAKVASSDPVVTKSSNGDKSRRSSVVKGDIVSVDKPAPVKTPSPFAMKGMHAAALTLLLGSVVFFQM